VRRRTPAKGSPELPPPRELEAYTFQTEGDEFLVLSYELPKTILPADLTPAEREVVLAVALGGSDAEVAAARGTSARTVANQLQSIYRKLRVASRAELLAMLKTSSSTQADATPVPK
jgi:DNA-binding CsgD family transcriptional regulator